MKDHKYGLFLKRRFLPIFTAQFLGAFNDNMLRSGLLVLIAYAGVKGIELPLKSPEVLVTLCGALLVMPFVLFSYMAGQLADKYEKARLVTLIKIVEIGIMTAAFYGFANNNVHLLMAMLFISGTHSTFFGPIKYSILPDHLRPGELLAGNGFVSAGTFLGILLGQITGGLLALHEGNAIGYALVGVAVAGALVSLFVPRSESRCPDMKLNFHLVHGTVDMIAHATRSRAAFYSILGLSWFLTIGSVFMGQFPNYAQGVVRGDNTVYTLFLAVFSVGIALGSTICDKLLKGEVSPRYASAALLAVSVFSYLMVLATPVPEHEGLATAGEFLSNPMHWPLLLTMLLVAASGGIFMVPLYAMLQTETAIDARSRVIAASNMSDSLMIVLAAVICAGLLALGLKITHLFVLVATFNLIMVLYARKAAKGFADRPA